VDDHSDRYKQLSIVGWVEGSAFLPETQLCYSWVSRTELDKTVIHDVGFRKKTSLAALREAGASLIKIIRDAASHKPLLAQPNLVTYMTISTCE
jgi:hypothetical protein